MGDLGGAGIPVDSRQDESLFGRELNLLANGRRLASEVKGTVEIRNATARDLGVGRQAYSSKEDVLCRKIAPDEIRRERLVLELGSKLSRLPGKYRQDDRDDLLSYSALELFAGASAIKCW